MRKSCIWVYRFYLFDCVIVYAYSLRAKNIEHAKKEMQVVINRDFFPDLKVLGVVRLCTAAKYKGKLDFPEYING